MHDFGLSPDTVPTTATAPIAIMPQRFEPFIAEAIDGVPADRLPDIRLAGSPRRVRAALAGALAASRIEPRWLNEWLLANMSFQLRLFSQLVSNQAVSLRLETIGDDGCPRFHTDAVRNRLLCTYRGPGTQWLDPRVLGDHADGQAIAPASIRQLDRGDVAIIRGSRGATPDRPALVHRSPPIEGTGLVRLLLVIDADEG